ncbi:MAG: putative collagen-binding domain-containing protein [Thermoguttaceae bacterium]
MAAEAWVVYVPRGNASRNLAIAVLRDKSPPARWFNPRTGQFFEEAVALVSGAIPPRPAPPDEDWVLLLR